MIGPVSSLGAVQNETPAEKAATLAFCNNAGFFAPLFTRCQNLGADIYEQIQYGGIAQPGQAPGPCGPGSSADCNMEAYRAAMAQKIKEQEAAGYHPDYPTYQSLTATNLQKELDDTTARMGKLVEYAIAGAILFVAISVSR